MKRLANYLIAMALVAFTFTSCEDVPSPYGTVVAPPADPSSTVTFEASGNGTLATPYNVQGVLEYIETLGADVTSPNDVYIKGYITSLTEVSAQYGNATFEMSDSKDGGNKFTVYRAKGLNNQAVTDEKFIKEGDEVIICGKVVNYKGNTPETSQGNAYVYSVNGVGGDTPSTPTTGEAKGTGTQADPFNIAAAIAKCKEVGETASTEKYYIKGIVVTGGTASGGFGNVTFKLGDTKDATDVFTAYQVAGTDGESLADGFEVKAGSEVVVYGPVVNYKGNTPETSGKGAAQIVTIDGKKTNDTPSTPATGDAKGTGTKDDPFNVAAIINYVSGLAADTDTNADYYVKGIVTKIPDGNSGISTQYNNVSFYISDDAAGSNSFYVFRAKGLNGGDVTADVIKVGDEVVIFGSTWVNYKGNTPETKQGQAYIVSVSSGSDTPSTPSTGTGVTREVSGTTLTLTNTAVTASSNTVSADLNAQGWANNTEPSTVTLTDGTTISFGQGDGTNAPKFYEATKGVRCYAKNTITIKGASKAIAKAVLTCDSYNGTDYVGNSTLTATASGTTLTIVNEHSDTSGGTQLRVQTIAITYAE